MEKIPQLITLILFLFFWFFTPVFSYVAESPSYKLEVDSVNVGGLDNSSSASYGLSDTIGEIGTGSYESASQFVKAGYRQMIDSGEYTITITLPSDVTMSPVIDGVNGGASNGSVTWTVTTDNPSGYSLFAKAATSPALKSSSDSFVDYTSASAGVPEYSWQVADSAAEFGYTVEGADTYQTFKDDGVNCGTGSINGSDTCWLGFSTSNTEVARRTSTAVSGITTTLKFRAELGSSKKVAPGDYTSNITVTALAI